MDLFVKIMLKMQSGKLYFSGNVRFSGMTVCRVYL